MKNFLSAMLQAGMSLGLIACIKDDEIQNEIIPEENIEAEKNITDVRDLKVSDLLDQIA